METSRFIVSACLVAAFCFIFHISASRANPVRDDQSGLPPCPDSPNCVSSKSGHPGRAVAPLVFHGSTREAMECLKRVISAMKRTRIVHFDSRSLQAEFRTLLGFVDDVSFELDAESGVIHMRSASRVGYWDMGVNRRRLEKIRRMMHHECRRPAE